MKTKNFFSNSAKTAIAIVTTMPIQLPSHNI